MGGGPHILVVEDDQSLRAGLRVVLERAGYTVSVAIRGEEALRTIREAPPDLVILDLMLPGLDGNVVLKMARQEGFQAPVIIVSARDRVEDKIHGLHTGADDYVTKPFDLEELLARIAVRLRRAHAGGEVRFGDVVVDLSARQARRAGEIVHLTPKEFDLLEFFVAHAGIALGRGRILEEVWGADYQGTRRTVDNFVRALRIKLERDPEQPRHFVTVWARGYRFEQGSASGP
jgi:two-component system, OmpR family, alkaline phosphatase synthesis response regulator PhoP